MGWDPERPVPWRRLLKEWALYASLMTLLFAAFFRDSSMVGILLGLLASGPLYLLFGYVMAKFGYQRQTLREARSNAQTMRELKHAATQAPPPRAKPAPTKRTSAGRSGQRRR